MINKLKIELLRGALSDKVIWSMIYDGERYGNGIEDIHQIGYLPNLLHLVIDEIEDTIKKIEDKKKDNIGVKNEIKM